MSNSLLNDLNITWEGELTINGLTLPFLIKSSEIKSYSTNIVDDTSEFKSENKYSGDVEFLKNKILKKINITPVIIT